MHTCMRTMTHGEQRTTFWESVLSFLFLKISCYFCCWTHSWASSQFPSLPPVSLLSAGIATHLAFFTWVLGIALGSLFVCSAVFLSPLWTLREREREISFSHWRTWRTPVRWPGDRVTITDSSLECSSFILSSWGKGVLLLRLNQKIFHLLAWWYFSVVHIFKATHQNTLVQMNNLVLDCFFNNIWNLFLISIDKNLLQADSFFFSLCK